MGNQCLISQPRVELKKFPKIAIQQTWVGKKQNCIVDIVSRYDLLQVKMTVDQVESVKAINPKAIILPFDSMGEPKDKMPDIWSTSGSYTPERQIQNISDECPIYHGNGEYRGIPFDGKNFQKWKAEQLVSWKKLGYDGAYVDLWYNSLRHSPPELSVDSYKKGMDHLAKEIRTLWPDGIFIGNGATNLDHGFDLNGFFYEDYPIFVWPFKSLFSTIDLWQKNGTKPVMIIINQRSMGVDTKEDHSSMGEVKADFWQRARYAITASMLWDETYVMYDYGSGGSPHWANPWFFDEYDVDVGQPLGQMKEIKHHVYFREFAKGAVICNMSAQPVIIEAQDIGSQVYYRFRGNQQPNFNNGKRFKNVRLNGWGFHNSSEGPIGDGIILVKKPEIAVADIIIDDAGYDPNDWGTNMAPQNNICGRFTESGLHYDGEKNKIWQDAWRIHGHNSCYYGSGKDSNVFGRWTPKIGLSGKYEVFEWHPSDDKLSQSVMFVIMHRSKIDSVTIDQSKNGGKWNSIGTYEFDTAKQNYVEISNKSNRTFVADAIKLVFKRSLETADTIPPRPPEGIKIIK